MKLTNNPKDFTSAQWPDMTSHDNGNLIYCGELQRRYRYESEPGLYSLYMTDDGVTYQKVNEGQVLIPSFTMFGARSYRIHLVLVRNDIRYDFKDSFGKIRKDNKKDLYYNELRSVSITVRINNISRYIAQCRQCLISPSDIGSLIKNELSDFCRSRKYDRLWKEQFTKRINIYGFKCCYVNVGRPEKNYRSLPENLLEHNRKILEIEAIKHKAHLTNIEAIKEALTKAEVEKIKTRPIEYIRDRFPNISTDEIINILTILGRPIPPGARQGGSYFED